MARVSAACAAASPPVASKESRVLSSPVSIRGGALSWITINEAMSSKGMLVETRAEALLRSALVKNDALLAEAQELEEIIDFYLLPASSNSDLCTAHF